MGRGSVNGTGQGLNGDQTTSGAVCITSLPCATHGQRAVLRLGDKTTPCPICGKPGVIVDSLPAMTWDGIPTVLDGAEVQCGCPPGTNRLIAPLESSDPALLEIGPATAAALTVFNLAPVENTVNDRAAAREAIISKVRFLGHHFIDRSGWHAKEPKSELEPDWNYSMIALHHAGRGSSCGFGPRQMVEIQVEHQSKNFSDIGYHYAIDCKGTVYEGTDIRLKGSNVRSFNTGVIGIVLLNNLTTVGEGGGVVALTRKILDSAGISTTNKIPAPQANATLDLVTALKSVFAIKHFGGHKEYPGQDDDGKTCPGNIGMKLVQRIRKKNQLLMPPLK
jgi:uncharacterized Zn-binding protein involved in type VI secretion